MKARALGLAAVRRRSSWRGNPAVRSARGIDVLPRRDESVTHEHIAAREARFSQSGRAGTSPAPPAAARQALAVDPHQRTVVRLGDEVVARRERAVPPAGFDALGPGQQLQRPAVEQRLRLPLGQRQRLRQQPHRARQRHGGLGRAAGWPAPARAPLPGIAGCQAVPRSGRWSAHQQPAAAPARGPRRACRRSISRVRPSLRAGGGGEELAVGRGAALQLMAAQAQLQRGRGQRQPRQSLAQQQLQVLRIVRGFGQRERQLGVPGCVGVAAVPRVRGASPA